MLSARLTRSCTSTVRKADEILHNVVVSSTMAAKIITNKVFRKKMFWSN